jgi:hypothetical protein
LSDPFPTSFTEESSHELLLTKLKHFISTHPPLSVSLGASALPTSLVLLPVLVSEVLRGAQLVLGVGCSLLALLMPARSCHKSLFHQLVASLWGTVLSKGPSRPLFLLCSWCRRWHTRSLGLAEQEKQAAPLIRE